MKNQVDGRVLLNVIVGNGITIFQLLSCINQVLVVGRNTFLVVDLVLDAFDRVFGLYFKRNRLSSQGLDKELNCCSCLVCVV